MIKTEHFTGFHYNTVLCLFDLKLKVSICDGGEREWKKKKKKKGKKMAVVQ